MNGVELIAAERQRQIEVEGWTPEHDDAGRSGELALAAACYVGSATDALAGYDMSEAGPPPAWPWAPEWFKRKDPIRDLMRAGALIAAEIDRLQRQNGGA